MFSLNLAQFVLRLGRGKESKKNAERYIRSSKQRIILRAAATAWASGVPWGTAVKLTTRAINKAASGKVKSLPPKCGWKMAKAKAKPKAKAAQRGQ